MAEGTRFFGNTARVFIFERPGAEAGQLQYLVRPDVVLVDGNQILFRNFSPHRVTLDASFVAVRPLELAARGSAGDRLAVTLADGVEPGFYEYTVQLDVATGKRVEAVGASRPGAIIDR